MGDDRVLIDTSIWIDYLQESETKLYEKVDEFLAVSDVFVPRVVIAELIQGAKSQRQIKIIEKFLEASNIIDQTPNTWIDAGKLSFSMKRY